MLALAFNNTDRIFWAHIQTGAALFAVFCIDMEGFAINQLQHPSWTDFDALQAIVAFLPVDFYFQHIVTLLSLHANAYVL